MAQLFRCFLLTSWQIRRLSYQAPVLRVSRRIYTDSIPEELSVYAHTMSMPGSGPDSSQHLKLSSAKGIQLYGVFRSKNLEKLDRKSILS